MRSSALDVTALLVGLAIALIITGALGWALRRGEPRRGWIAAGALFVGFAAVGVADLLRHAPRETPFSTVLIGAAIPILGTLGMVRGTRRLPPWGRWPLVSLVAFLLVFGGLLAGTMLTRWLPF